MTFQGLQEQQKGGGEMAFADFLVHTCTIALPGKEQTGVDDWGRPIYQDKKPIDNVPCRFITKNSNVFDEVSQNFIFTTSLLLLPTQAIDEEMIITNIKDANGYVLDARKFNVKEILPRYDASELVNWRLEIKGAK